MRGFLFQKGGLMTKLLSKWQAPKKQEIDVWYHLDRK